MHRMPIRFIIGLLVLFAGLGLAACDTIEERSVVEGRYEAAQFETLVAIRDSIFQMDLLAAGSQFEVTLTRTGERRSMQGRLVIPEGTFADSILVFAGLGRPAGTLDGLDHSFSGSFVIVQHDLRLGLNADTTAQPSFSVPTRFTIQDRGERLRNSSGSVFLRLPGSVAPDTFSVTNLIMQKK